MMEEKIWDRRRSEKGQVLMLVALVFVGLLAVAGLAVDGGNLYAQRRQAQNAADAAALAGTHMITDAMMTCDSLDLVAYDLDIARKVNEYAELNDIPDTNGAAGDEVNDHQVAAAITGNGVVARATVDGVVARAAGDLVIARVSENHIASLAAGDCIASIIRTVQGVVARTTLQHVAGAPTAEQLIAAAVAHNRVGPGPAVKMVVAAAADDRVVPVAAVEDCSSGKARGVERVGARSTRDVELLDVTVCNQRSLRANEIRIRERVVAIAYRCDHIRATRSVDVDRPRELIDAKHISPGATNEACVFDVQQ